LQVDIFSKALLLIPVHLGQHWVLCSVDFICHRITYYDSMEGHNKECIDVRIHLMLGKAKCPLPFWVRIWIRGFCSGHFDRKNGISANPCIFFPDGDELLGHGAQR